MSYTPIGWQTGDTITADKLNKMDPGWGVVTAAQTLFNDSVTTESSEYGNEAQVSMTQITADTITVTFGGTEYTATKIVVGDFFGYGGVDAEWNYDFTEYPFAIVSKSGTTFFSTETAGTFSFKIDEIDTAIETSDAFGSAVKKCSPLFLCINGETTYNEMAAARTSGFLLYFYYGSTCHFITNFSNEASPTAVDALPAGAPNIETYGFNDGMVFTIYNY